MTSEPTTADRPGLSAFALRALGAADAREAAEVIRAAFAAQSRTTRPPSSALRETADTVAAKIAAGGGVGAFQGGSLVAVVLWQVDGDALHVGRVSVVPPFRARGLTRRLIEACEAAARERGVRRIETQKSGSHCRKTSGCSSGSASFAAVSKRTRASTRRPPL